MPKDRRSHKAAARKAKGPVAKDSRARPAGSEIADVGFLESARSGASFPIVGIGASAGGLEAFTALLTNLPADTGMAFVLVQHMDPNHESVLQSLLQRATPMPVLQVTDGMVAEPNHVYVIPPNTFMTISKGVLALASRPERLSRNLPIDHFLTSLAEDVKMSAIGVILSGTASDGTLGLKAIKAEGGVTFAQDKESAKYPSMPLSAAAAGYVDFTLPPEGIAAELARISSHPYLYNHGSLRINRLPEAGDDDVRRICLLLRTLTGVDFTLYKQATVSRRVARRMAIRKMESGAQYIELLLEDRKELTALSEDIFIHVTGFFRDPEVMEALQRSVIPAILSRDPSPEIIRIWVPGCSSGEEVYTIAMVFFEQLGDRSSQAKLQIFGTDISEKEIERARAGIYSESSMEDVSRDRQRRFFSKIDGSYQVAKSVREACIFARHDLAKDPPFSRIDLISCRNVLIYMTPILQKRVIENLHYALQPNGFLLMGKSESLAAYANLFSAQDSRNKIFSRVASGGALATAAAARERQPVDRNPANTSQAVRFDPRREAERALLDQHTPAAFVVDSNFHIVHFQGNTSPFLSPATGEPSFHLLKLVRPEFSADLRAAIQKARKEGVEVRKEGIGFRQNGDLKTVNLSVSLLKGSESGDPHFLAVLQDAVEPPQADARQTKRKRLEAGTQAKAETLRLEEELASTREQLRNIVQEHEAAIEELQAMHEEVLSSNEELQSTNEELETAKEELESSNEELHTVNDELQNRNTQLSQLSDDLSNLLIGVRVPIVFLDTAMRIRRFTPAAGEVLNLIPSDVGRPVTDIAPTLSGADLGKLAAEVIARDQVVEQEVQDRRNRWHELRIRPYKSVDQKIHGALIALFDIDAIKSSFDEARAARDFADAIVETMREPLLVLDGEIRIVRATKHFYETFAVSRPDTEGKILYTLGNGQWNVPRLRQLLEQIIPRDSRFENFELEHTFPSIGRRNMLLNARQIQRSHNAAPMILLAIEDVTEKKQAEEESLRGRVASAQEEERKRIARELHDDLIQRLADLAIDMGRNALKHPESSAALRKKFRSVQSSIVQAAEVARHLAHELHPSEVDDLGLEAALRSYSEEFGKRARIAVKFTSRKLPRALPAEIVYCLYRVARESLQNVAKHARTKRVTVTIEGTANAVRLSVEDSGVGFLVESLRAATGLGVVSMRERLQLVGGTLTTTSQRGKGTRVIAEIPLKG